MKKKTTQKKKAAKAAQAETIEPRETPINAPISFAIMLVAGDVKHALEIYDGLVAAGVNPQRIAASVRQVSDMASVARASSPVMQPTRGANEAAFNARYGTFRTFTPAKEIALGINGLTREEQIGKVLALRDSGMLTKDVNNVYWLNGQNLNKLAGEGGNGASSAGDAPSVDTEGLTEIDPEECV